MKSRRGFVSNSSSSSFLIVGTQTSVDAILRAMGWRENDDAYGNWEEWEDSWGGQTTDGKYAIIGSETPYYIGFNAEPYFRSGMTFQEISALFAKSLYEDFGLILDSRYIDLHYGEVGNG